MLVLLLIGVSSDGSEGVVVVCVVGGCVWL